MNLPPQPEGLYDPAFEHDSCGVGCLCRLDGRSGHDVVQLALKLLVNMSHRGAAGADASSGDGAGILLALPDRFVREHFGSSLPPEGSYGLGQIFLPARPETAGRCRETAENVAESRGWRIRGWREVPVNPAGLGQLARDTRPSIWQFAVTSPGRDFEDAEDLERQLYILRKCLERKALQDGLTQDEFYISSLSARTVVYKGMLIGPQLEDFYPDLRDPLLESPLAVVHQRYSTNTFPSWRLAQPFRGLAHNGEINTIRGNRAWLTAREPNFSSPLFGADIEKIRPIIEPDSSDSASLDNALEFLMRGGRSLEHALTMLLPQAWGQKYPMSTNLRGFFEYHAGLMEPWDGPAAVVVTDGRKVGAALDRNGLRPARYSLTEDGLLVMASESGALTLENSKIVEKGSLRPGQMILAEAGSGRLLKNTEVKSLLARRRPYRRWVSENRLDIPGFFTLNPDFTQSLEDLPFRQTLFGYTREDTEIIVAPMAANGQEPNGSMGADIPLAVLDQKPQPLFAFFRQQFAQVTNPPIDPIREELVMSLMTFMGYDSNILKEEPGQARLIKLTHPFLSNDDLARLKDLRGEDFRSTALSAVFPLPEPGRKPGQALAEALDRLEEDAVRAAREGARIIVISDRAAGQPAGEPLLPIPSLLAAAAVNRRLLETGQRVSAGLILETGDALEVSHMAMLLSLGASAVNPYLAYETAADLAARQALAAELSPTTAVENYVLSLKKGLLKIMSKMGISTLRGYRGAQIFEAVGLGPELMDRYFPGIPSRVGGLGLAYFEEGAAGRFRLARSRRQADPRDPEEPLPAGGAYRWRRRGQSHLWTAESLTLLQEAVRRGDYGIYKKYAALINDQSAQAFTLRGLMDFRLSAPKVPLEEVEPESELVKHFATGAMSFGSLSREAHLTMALAMNSLGARSNSGEGGEDPERYKPRPDGGSSISAIKQVASGRFGVTAEYLAQAKELQIKIAQGAKPGEGGQLPGHKVDSEIARVRHSTPGVTLISPPPHHDIYSIEDIAQLIHDLHQAADQATVSVKLVSVVGVGTIAAGVAKAQAESILISGFDGGTGAAPLSSIRQAGSPWEIGLAETQQTLVRNNLRTRVRLQCDGQLKTGRDAAVAALLGADEFGFATAVLVSMGCLMMRKCHTNTCPVGVATQDPRMRSRFTGEVRHVVNFFTFAARELREIMAALGFRTLREMTGQADRLMPRSEARPFQERGLDFSRILHKPASEGLSFQGYAPRPPAATLDDQLLDEVREAVETGRPLVITRPVHNTDRTVGAKISSRIVRAHALAGLPDGTITLKLTGIAGQSFGAFLARGLTLDLAGEANDYVGKGLSGGRIIIRPPDGLHPDFTASENTIIGNVALYGATAGELYLAGKAGERFAVRNSGALAVAEGVGDHGCEYMTGGRAVILGPTGVNFAAGMSGGLAYVYDQDGFFDNHCNLEMVDLDLLDREDEEELRDLISRHRQYTGSRQAERILSNWTRDKAKFIKVFPMEYRRGITLENRSLGRRPAEPAA